MKMLLMALDSIIFFLDCLVKNVRCGKICDMARQNQLVTLKKQSTK